MEGRWGDCRVKKVGELMAEMKNEEHGSFFSCHRAWYCCWGYSDSLHLLIHLLKDYREDRSEGKNSGFV